MLVLIHLNILNEDDYMEQRSNLTKFKTEYFGKSLTMVSGFIIVALTISIIIFLSLQGIKTFTLKEATLSQFLTSSVWQPDAVTPKFGALIFIFGSSAVAIGAVLLSTPIALAIAITTNYIAPKIGKTVIQPALELFVGIPSVIYGWLGMSILVPFLRSIIGGIGFSLLAAIIVLTIMILPTITSISSDAMKVLPKDFTEASFGLGATRWQTISKVIIPSAKNGILTGVVLGLARAFGEALAVQMVIGNSLRMVDSLFKPTSTITGAITMGIPNTVAGTPQSDALWSLALILLIISFIFIAIIQFISNRRSV